MDSKKAAGEGKDELAISERVLLPMTVFLPHPFFLAAVSGHGEQRATIFFAQVLLLIAVGRLLGEWMQRIGQPAVIGQLLAGIILGPSVFGAIWPAGQQAIFPPNSSDQQMLNAVSDIGVLLLLLLTGMETDLALVKRVRRTAAITSAAGIVIPFGCGYVLGEMLPDSVLPDPNRRLLTSLFLATALSISSVKIVAAVLREVDYLRRNLGQVILSRFLLHHRRSLGRANHSLDERSLCHRDAHHQRHPGDHDCSGAGD
jgi:hypothetical protein